MPLKVRTVGYLFQEAMHGIRKNSVMSFASVGSVALSLFILSIFLVLAVNVQHIADTVEAQVRVVAFMEEGFDRSQKESVELSLSRVPGVTGVRFVTKEEALERLRQQFGKQAALLDAVEEHNPLRDSFEIQVRKAEDAAGVVGAVRKVAGVNKVVYQQETVRRLQKVTAALRALGMILVVILAAGTIFLISNTIRISVFSRRREIGIMKLVGATDGFIKWPFFIEGTVLGCAGALVSAVAIWFSYVWFNEKVSSSLPFIPLVPVEPFMLNLAKVILVMGMGLGALGSVVSVRKHLRV